MNSAAGPWRVLLPILAAAALVVGILARFKGLGYAPFAVDEYYLAQSIEGVLRSGLPAFACGGFYTRGLLIQYISAGAQLAGVSGEFAPRLICAVSSLIALPAAYKLGRRLRGPVVAMLLLTVLAISVWEIEMARFGRMYAPFQALFLWYLYYFLRYTVDGERRALRVMIALSIVGPFIWEGGIFLLLTNMLPVFLKETSGRLPQHRHVYLGGAFALVVTCYAFLKQDFRGVRDLSVPTGFDPAQTQGLIDPIALMRAPFLDLPHHPLWFVAALVVLATLIPASRWLWTLRSRPILAVGIVATMFGIAFHQFLLSGALLLLMLMMRTLYWRELLSAEARYFRYFLLAAGLFWLTFGLVATNWNDAASGSTARRLAMLAYQYLKFPDFVGVVVRPWASAIPHLGATLLVLCFAAMIRMARSEEELTSERVLLVVLLLMLLAASASHPPRQETRYVFNLYPLALLISLTTISRVATALSNSPAVATGITTALALGSFTLSEDFRPHHLRYIDTPEETFRLGMNQGTQSHLVIRDDYRQLSRWLQGHVPQGTVVVNGVHGLDHYYPFFSYFYVDESSPNFPDWSCRSGTVERWGNYPLLYSVDALSAKIGGGATAYLVTFGYEPETTLKALVRLQPHIVATVGAIIVIELRG